MDVAGGAAQDLGQSLRFMGEYGEDHTCFYGDIVDGA